MSSTPPETAALRVADLPQNRPTRFTLTPEAKALTDIASELGVDALRKLRFEGEIKARGKRDWVLKAKLGFTVTQPCVVTLEPVTTRIDTEVTRTYLAEMPEPEGEEVEMPEDDTQEQLGSVIDPGQVMVEALALALPLYPRKEGVGSGDASFAGPGITPMTDEEAKPFAGLAALRDSLKKEE